VYYLGLGERLVYDFYRSVYGLTHMPNAWEYLLTHSTTRHRMFLVGTSNVLILRQTFGQRKKVKKVQFPIKTQLTLKVIWGSTILIQLGQC
jgi:hypothetical protein